MKIKTKLSLLALTLAFGVGLTLAASLPSSPLKIGGQQAGVQLINDLSVYAPGGDLSVTMPYNTSPLKNDNGTVAVGVRMTVTVTKPDASVVTFKQLTDADGRIRGQIYGSIVNQVGSYTLQVAVDGGGPSASTTFQILERAQLDRNNQTFTGNNQTFRNDANSADAFQIQNATGTDVLDVNTLTSTVTIANLVVTGTCSGCGSGGGAGTLQDAYTNSATPAGITTTAAGKTVFVKAGTGADSATLFTVQNAAGANVLAVDTASTKVVVANLETAGSVTAGTVAGSGSGLTNLNASNLGSGTLADARLTANVTLQGNTFNGASQLVQLNGSTQLPAVSGALLTNLNATNIASGTLDNARLNSNVTILGQTIQNSEVDDDLTISSAGSVDWTALNNYPSACAAGQAVTALNDTPTCTAFIASETDTLDSVYERGNVLGTSDGRNIDFTLADTTTDASFNVTIADNATGSAKISRANGGGTNDPAQLLELSNADLSRAVPAALKITNAGGGFTTVIDNEGTLISGTELNLLDGHNVALIDTDDAVNTAITGTGALNAGSITSGFGNIDIGADTFTGNGSGLTSLNGSNISTGTVADARLTANVSLLGQTIQNAEVDDDLTISSAGSVDWTALNNYPAACAAGQAITALGDTTTCTAFLSGETDTLDSVYERGNQIGTSDGRNIDFTLADTTTDANFAVDIASGSLGQFKVTKDGGASNLLLIGSTGQLLLPATGPGTGLNIGGDANLYRSAVDTLSTTSHLVLSGDANQGLSGGGLTDCDTAATSKLLWDTTTNKFSCGTDTAGGGGGTLQNAYDATNGNTITTTTGRDIDITLSNDATDANFLVDIATSSTSRFAVQKNNVDMFGVGATGDLAIKGTVDSTTALLFEDKDGNDLLEIDSTNDRIQIGDATADGTAIPLVLDSKNTDGDPALVDGAMYYNSSTGNFRCKQSSSDWKDCDIPTLRENWFMYEEWINAATTSGGQVGDNTWIFNPITTAGSSGTYGKVDVGALAADQNRFGVIKMGSSATENNTGGTLTIENTSINGAPADLTVEFDFASTTNNIQQAIRIGLHDQTGSGAPNDGIYFQYNVTTTAGNWFRCTRVSGTETCTDTGVAKAAINTYQRFKMVTNPGASGQATSVEYFINETSVGTNSTNLPAVTDSFGPAIQWMSVNNVAKTWKMDYFQLRRTDVTR